MYALFAKHPTYAGVEDGGGRFILRANEETGGKQSVSNARNLSSPPHPTIINSFNLLFLRKFALSSPFQLSIDTVVGALVTR